MNIIAGNNILGMHYIFACQKTSYEGILRGAGGCWGKGEGVDGEIEGGMNDP